MAAKILAVFAMLTLAARLRIAAGPEIAPTGAINPCANLKKSCGELVCPGGSKLVTYAGHCCPYCESTVEIIDTKDYSKSAAAAFQAYGTAPYGGGYKPQPPVPGAFVKLIQKAPAPAPHH